MSSKGVQVELDKLVSYKKIWITGAVASGKTTLAKKLSIEKNCLYYELDNLVHIRRRSGNLRRNSCEIKEILEKIYAHESWIVEGVYREDYHALLDKVDCIVVLETPLEIRNNRILTRWVRQRYGFELCSYNPTVKMLSSMYNWSSGYEADFPKNMKILAPYQTKTLFIGDTSELYAL